MFFRLNSGHRAGKTAHWAALILKYLTRVPLHLETPRRYIQTRGVRRYHVGSKGVGDQWPPQPDWGQCACFIYAVFENKFISLSVSFFYLLAAQNSPPSKRSLGVFSVACFFLQQTLTELSPYAGDSAFLRGHNQVEATQYTVSPS